MTKYAEGTVVTERESRAQIATLLERSECTDAVVGLNAAGNGVVKFSRSGRTVRMLVTLPSESLGDARARERARRWRVLLLLLKAKLEAVASGISTFEDEFLSYIAMPDGESVGKIMAPQVSEAYRRGFVLGGRRAS